MLEKTIQKKLSELLLAGYTQKSLADKLGISQASVHKIKSGKTLNCLHKTALGIEALYSLEFTKKTQKAPDHDAP